MAIKPEQIISWPKDGVQLEKLIDADLKAKWKGNNTVTFNLPSNTSEMIVDKLIALYARHGWGVRRRKGESQKDGDWNCLEFSVPALVDNAWHGPKVANPRQLIAEEIKRWSWTSDGARAASCPDAFVATDKILRILGVKVEG